MEPISTGYALTVFFDMFCLGCGVLAGITVVSLFDRCDETTYREESIPALNIQRKKHYL